MNYNSEYFENIYHRIENKERKEIIKAHLDFILKAKPDLRKILDLACGEGDFLKEAEIKIEETFGIEISKEAFKKAKSKLKKTHLFPLDLEKDSLPFDNNFFDCITAIDVLEHLVRVDFLLKEIFRVLKEKGLFYMVTPNLFKGFFKNLYDKYFPDPDFTHKNKQSVNFWKRKLEELGFKDIKIKGCLFYGIPPFPKMCSYFRKKKWPYITKPFFFPFKSLTPHIFIWAYK